MTKKIDTGLIIGVLFWLVGLAACAPPPPAISEPTTIPPTVVAESTARAEPAELAHDFSLHTLDGQVLTLSQQRGGFVLVNFWATWCTWCVEEMPYLQEVADRGDIQVWGVNMRETVDEMNTFVEEHNISFPILLSPDNDTILAYPGGMPRTFIIGPEGDIVHTIFGPIDPIQFDAWLAKEVESKG